jgi:hypothetical protein
MVNVDMQIVKEAMARRARGDIGGGAPIPAGQQMTSPEGTTPVGGPNTPVEPPTEGAGIAGTATPTPAMPPVDQTNQMLQAAGGAQSPQFDDETKAMSKALIAKLLKYV